MAAFIAGLALGLSLIVAIGAQNTFVLRQGLRREHVGAVVATCAASDAVLMAIGVGGLGTTIGTRPALMDAMALGGAAFLSWYGFSAARRAWQGESMRVATGGAAQSRGRVLAQALAFTLLNPHVYLDTVLLVGTVGAKQAEGARLLFLGGACSASALWFSAVGYGARLLAPLFARPLAWRVLDTLVALVMEALAATLLRGVLVP